MAHTFDSGLAKPTRTLVREAVIARLAPLLVANGGYLSAIKGMPRMVRGLDDSEGYDHAKELLQGQAPGVLVALGDLTVDRTGTTGHQWVGDLIVQVLVLSNHARSLEDRLGGDPVALADDSADPGIEVILEHVAELLTGADPGLGPRVWQLRPESEQEMGTEKATTLWGQTYRVTVSRDVAEYRESLDAITSWLIDWRARPAPTSSTESTFTQELTP